LIPQNTSSLFKNLPPFKHEKKMFKSSNLNLKKNAIVSKENKKNIPYALLELYDFIGRQNDFDIAKMNEIIFRDDFQLLLDSNHQEQRLSEDDFQDFHDHCFETPLLAICHIASQHNNKITDRELKKLIRRLVSLHADVHAVDEEGNSAILLLSSSLPDRSHLIESIQLLINEGADINAVNYEGKNVLHRSFELMNFSLASLLYFDLGARVVWDKNNSTFLLECEEHSPEELSKKINELTNHLFLHHLLATNISEDEDHLYRALIEDPSGKLALKLCKTKTLPITAQALDYAFKHFVNDDVASAIINCLEERIRTIYSSREFLIKRGLHKTHHSDKETSFKFRLNSWNGPFPG
jgi:ankyrin repeat protein